MGSELDARVSAFFSEIGVECSKLSELDGSIIERSKLIEEPRYQRAKLMIPGLKEFFSSSYLTSLQNKAPGDHKWPLVNLVRQMLKQCGFKMTPKRLSDGYSKAGKKKFRRVYIVEAMKPTSSAKVPAPTSQEQDCQTQQDHCT